MAIRKAVIETVVLFDDAKIDPALFEDGTLADMASGMTGQACLELSTLTSMEVIPPERLEEEQLAIDWESPLVFSVAEADTSPGF